MIQPQRRDEAHRKRHLDASVVPVERALLHRAEEIEKRVPTSDPRLLSAAQRMVAAEFRALAEELHYW